MNMRKPAPLLFVILLAACQRIPADPVARGKATFDAVGCTQCHQVGAKGTAWGPDLTTVGFRKSPEWLSRWLQNPHGWRKDTVMPNFNLPEETRADLVAYLSTLKGQDWEATGKPWDHPDVQGHTLKRGAVIFEKAGCVACHGQEGRGGYPNNNVVGGQIPSLTKVVEGYTKEELVAKIRGGVVPTPEDPSQPAPMIQMPKWGDYLKKDELSAVADYLISLGKKSKSASNW